MVFVVVVSFFLFCFSGFFVLFIRDFACASFSLCFYKVCVFRLIACFDCKDSTYNTPLISLLGNPSLSNREWYRAFNLNQYSKEFLLGNRSLSRGNGIVLSIFQRSPFGLSFPSLSVNLGIVLLTKSKNLWNPKNP